MNEDSFYFSNLISCYSFCLASSQSELFLVLLSHQHILSAFYYASQPQILLLPPPSLEKTQLTFLDSALIAYFSRFFPLSHPSLFSSFLLPPCLLSSSPSFHMLACGFCCCLFVFIFCSTYYISHGRLKKKNSHSSTFN